MNEPGRLPVKGGMRWSYIFSMIIAVLVTIVSVSGILFRYRVYPTEDLFKTFMPNDIVNLAVGLPSLLGSAFAAWRGRLAGLLCWPGAIFFMLYNYLAYVFALPISWLFLLYLSIVAASIYTLAALFYSCDGRAVKKRLESAVSGKLAGGVLTGLGFLFILRVAFVVITAMQGGPMPTDAEFAVNISDFLIAPAWIMGGISLLRRKESGYIAALGLLFQGSMLFIALIIYLILKPVLTDAPFPAADIMVILVMGLVCFVPFGLFLKGTGPRAGAG